jgi:hypothetical protein
MSSPEFHILDTSLSVLKTDLMGFAPNSNGTYSKTELLMCQAFVVFSHAEIQVYWESVARRILTEAVRRWQANKEVGRVIATLMTFRHPEGITIPKDITGTNTNGSFNSIIEKAIKKQKEIIDKNSGIKRSNLADMLLPLGVFTSDFVEALLIQLDQIGAKRGDMVHKASSVSLRTIRDPHRDELKDIENLVSDIRTFDAKLEALGLLSVATAPTGTVAAASLPSVTAVGQVAGVP